jgi:hypothetical protein
MMAFQAFTSLYLAWISLFARLVRPYPRKETGYSDGISLANRARLRRVVMVPDEDGVTKLPFRIVLDHHADTLRR